MLDTVDDGRNDIASLAWCRHCAHVTGGAIRIHSSGLDRRPADINPDAVHSDSVRLRLLSIRPGSDPRVVAKLAGTSLAAVRREHERIGYAGGGFG